MHTNRNISQSLRASVFNPRGVIETIPIENIQLLRKSLRQDGDVTKLLTSIGHETLCAMIAQGYFIIQIAATLNISNQALHEWLTTTSEGEDAVMTARKRGAELYAYMSVSVLESDEAVFDKEELSRAKELSKRYASLAAQMDPGKYGAKTVSDVDLEEGRFAIQINIGAENFPSPLDALRSVDPLTLAGT